MGALAIPSHATSSALGIGSNDGVADQLGAGRFTYVARARFAITRERGRIRQRHAAEHDQRARGPHSDSGAATERDPGSARQSERTCYAAFE